MKIEINEFNEFEISEVYSGVSIKTDEGKQLYICLRDYGFEMKIDDGKWHLITNEEDFK